MLYASFVRPEGVYNTWFNKAAAFFTRGGNFCHSEFVFRWSKEELDEVLLRVKGLGRLRDHKGPIDIAFYILWGDRVQYRVLNGHAQFWSVPERDMIKVHTSWENELNTVTWLSHQLGRPYDRVGALMSPFAWRRPNNTSDHYFCSQLMACALQRLGKLKHLNPGGLTPNSLYSALHSA